MSSSPQLAQPVENPSPALTLTGKYYDGKTSHPHTARATIRGSSFVLELDAAVPDSVRTQFDIHELRLAPRLGNSPRAVRLPDGSLFETTDNDLVDSIDEMRGEGRPLLHVLESSLPWALGSLGVVLLIGAAAYLWGIPFIARQLARAIPPEVAYKMGQGTLTTLDKILFEPTKLPQERQAELRQGFAQMAAAYPQLPLHLEFRHAGMPNAFALPDGTVVVTDELEQAVQGDDEIYAVLAHEIGHVEHRHAARIAIESSAVGLLIMTVLGDASQVAGITASLPAVYANSSFSREHETEADTFALHYMKRTGQDPESFARALEDLTRAAARDAASEPGQEPAQSKRHEDALEYLSSHPATQKRIERFRSAR